MLSEQDSLSYWRERSNRLQECAVGFADKNLSQQNLFYLNVKRFIFTYVSRMAPTVDYGCGIGRHSEGFLGKYLGIDMIQNMISLAKKNNPDKNYICSDSPFIPSTIDITWMKIFFTATVLQHCDDDLVIKILKSVYSQIDKNFTFVLYENSEMFVKSHIIGRHPSIYEEFLKCAGFVIKNLQIHSHTNYKEEHSLLIAEV
jgi:trans-aconitate methyltransferase